MIGRACTCCMCQHWQGVCVRVRLLLSSMHRQCVVQQFSVPSCELHAAASVYYRTVGFRCAQSGLSKKQQQK